MTPDNKIELTDFDWIYPVDHRVPTCLGMMMAQSGFSYAQDEIDKLALQQGSGTYGSHKGILATARCFGFESSRMVYASKQLEDAEQLLLAILATQPAMVTGKFHHFPELGHLSGHAILLVGINRDARKILIHDPHHRKAADGSGVKMLLDLDDFISRWTTRHLGWIMWLRGDLTPNIL